MGERFARWRGRLIIGGLLVAIIAGAIGFWYYREVRVPDRVYRVGYEDNPPFHYRDPQGRPTGLACEVLSEAARRSGIRLEWAFCPESADMALRSGAVDLWPVMTILPERRPAVYFSDAWLHDQFCFITLDPSLKPDAAYSGDLGQTAQVLLQRQARERFPAARRQVFRTMEDITKAVCSGEVRAGLVNTPEAELSLFSQQNQCAGGTLLYVPLSDFTRELAIGSRPSVSAVADRLRREIDGMAHDGTLARMLSRFSYRGISEALRTSELLQERVRARWLTWGISGLAVALLGTAVLCLMLYRARQEVLRADADRAEYVRRFEYAGRATNDIIWERDLRTGEVTVSSAMEFVLGYPKDQVGSTFRWWDERIHPDDRERVRESIQKLEAGQESRWTQEYRFLTGQGSYAFIVDRGYLIYDEHQKPSRMIGALSDVTARRHLEEQLRQAQKMEAVGRLVGGIAHDFNNLITVINGYCELLLSDMDGHPQMQAQLAEIHKAGEKAESLVRQLLAFARRQIIEPVVLDFNRLVLGMEKMIARLVGEDIRVELALDPGVGCVLVDPGQMNQVILNLVVNARDAMPNGGSLRIETANVQGFKEMPRVAAPSGYVLIRVSDTGIGMDEGMQSRIFEPFFTTKEKGAGTGLGLSTVYGIIKQSNGFIYVDTQPRSGTTFRIYLPRVVREAPEISSHAQEGARAPATGTVLVVEDQEEVRSLTLTILRRAGYSVLEAGDGDQALEVCKSHNGRLDLLLTDVVMPAMNGMELAERARQLRPELRVLFMSGYSEDVIAHKGVVGPGIALVQKPFSAEALLIGVRNSLK